MLLVMLLLKSHFILYSIHVLNYINLKDICILFCVLMQLVYNPFSRKKVLIKYVITMVHVLENCYIVLIGFCLTPSLEGLI